MNNIFRKTALAMAVATTFGIAQAAEVDTKGGIKVKSDDGQFVGELGGRLHMDAYFFDNGDSSKAGFENDNGVFFRRLRLNAKGTMYGVWEGYIQADFRNAINRSNTPIACADVTCAAGAVPTNLDAADLPDVRIRDAYIAYSGFQFAKVFAGNLKIPMGLEELTSSNYLMFIERPAPLAAVVDGAYRRGLKLEGMRGNFSWQSMVYDANNRDNDNGASTESSAGLGVAGRLTWSPIKDKTQILHLGLSAAKELDAQNMNDRTTNYEMGLAEPVRFADFLTRAVDDDELLKTGLEIAYVNGPMTLVAEYLNADLDSEVAGDPEFGGYYVTASYFLTGEQRPYKASSGTFDRVKPLDKSGAWEILARLSSTEGEVRTKDKTDVENIALGVNYYFNPQVRWMLNLVSSDIDLGGTTEAFNEKALVTRIQFDF